MNDTEQAARITKTIPAIITLVVFAVSAAIILSSLDELTSERIAENEIAYKLRGLSAILPEGEYDNQPHLDMLFITAPDLLGSPESLPVYRARLGSKRVAVILTTISPLGYVGDIELLVSISALGEVIGVRAVRHRETPGLGDGIDMDQSNWIRSFDGLTSADVQSVKWRLARDGGSIDQLTGATVTSRAVTSAVRNAVTYFDAHQDELFAE